MTVISVMLAVPDAAEASEWYRRAFDATELWNLGSVIGLDVRGAPFFVAQPENRWDTPGALRGTTTRIEVFVDDPDALLDAAAAAGADYHDPVRDHRTPWGTHRQGGFIDPFGHFWLVGDSSPLRRHP
ncbi:VOC family protein [Cryptosporangium japonicum]|uniref:VOC domain-containing protein n=1 Tax=Cryptosporangium japonicum TaxID=80872 RepID=A0ABP3DRM7_9ACTN